MSGTVTVKTDVANQTVTVATQGPRGPKGSIDGFELIQSTADLAPYADATDSFYTLPANTQIVLAGTINIGSRYIVLSAGTMLRGFANATLTSSNTGGAIRCSSLASAVVMREFNIIATAGPCLNLSGPIDQQLNLFFIGLFGAAAGTITGFDVQALKDCFINTPIGLTLAGTTNKVFMNSVPIYGTTAGNSAITFDSTLNAGFIDIAFPYFKSGAGTAITAEAGYSVGEGRIFNGLIVAGMTPLAGFSEADAEWDIKGVSGVANSREIAEIHSTASDTVPIATLGTPVPIDNPSAAGTNIERFTTSNQSAITYTGIRPTTVMVISTLQIQPAGNNISGRVFFAQNGTPIADSAVPFFVGSGGDTRVVTVMYTITVETNDTLNMHIANDSGTTDITIPFINMIARG